MYRKVIFSDIDGTLIDAFTRDYGKSIEIVKSLSDSSIPVILCSSKTWAEQNIIRKDLELEGEPFIVENGGAVIIPNGYFGDLLSGVDVNGHRVIELGRPSAEIRKVLLEVRRETGITFRGVSDISVEDLAEIVGMTHAEATRMSKRQYGETILEIDSAQKGRFESILQEKGFQVIHGGRYFDVTAGSDKGKAVRILIDYYRKKLGDDTIFIGVGDSSNDIPMLKSTDVAMLVQKHDGMWADVDVPGLIRVEGIGPAGWENVFAKIMK